MSLPSYASAEKLATEALRGEHLVALAQARYALAHDDPAGALTAALRLQQRSRDRLAPVPPSVAAGLAGSSLVLQALASRQEDGEHVDGLLQQAVEAFGNAEAEGPLQGCALAEYATALALTGRLPQAVDRAERAVLAGDMVPSDVLLAVTGWLADHDAPERAERLLRKVLDRGPATPELVAALAHVVTSPEEAVSIQFAHVELLLGECSATDAIAIADRLADRLADVAGPHADRAADFLRVGIRLATGSPYDPSALRDHSSADLESAPGVVRLLALALVAAGRADVVAADMADAPYLTPPLSLKHAAVLLTAGRPREALSALEDLPPDATTLRLLAAAYEGLGAWRAAADTLRKVLETAPDDSDLIASLARLEAQAGSGTALSQVDSTLRRRPWDAILLGARAAVLALRGQHGEAVKSAEQAVWLAPGLQQPRAALAHGLLATDVDRSLEEAEQVLDRDPDNLDALYVTGQALRHKGDLEGSLTVLRRLCVAAPWHHAGLLLLGAVLESARRVEEARAVYDQMVAQRPLDPAPYVAAARLRWQVDDLPSARELLDEAMRVSPDDPEPMAGMAEVLRREGRLEEAESLLRAALDKQPDNGAWTGTLGQVQVAQGQIGPGLELLRRATSLDPGLGWASVEIGEALRAQNRPNEALSAYDAALRADPTDVWARAGKAAALTDLKQFDQALEEVDTALRHDDDYSFAWEVRGHIYLKVDRVDEAISALDRALTGAPDVAWLWANRGFAGSLAGEAPREVLRYLQRSVDLDPDDAGARCGLGYAQLGAGDSEAAREAFTTVLADLEGHRRDADASSLGACVWALLGRREWGPAAELAADVVALDRNGVGEHLSYGLALLCATATDEPGDPDDSEYRTALRRVAAQPHPGHRRYLLRAARCDLDDLELAIGDLEADPALSDAVGRARTHLDRAFPAAEDVDAARA